MVCANLREISWSFLPESSLLKMFVCGMNAKKELFSWADLYVYMNSNFCSFNVKFMCLDR